MMRSWILVLLLVGCGRTQLDESADDASVIAPEAACGNDAKPPVCNASTCQGCCEQSTGICRCGTSKQACGSGGEVCVKCADQSVCQALPTGGVACLIGPESPPAQCNAESCPNGCCARMGDSQDLYCFQGDGDYECGTGGQPCAQCNLSSDHCSGHQCSTSKCGGGMCQDGCCIGSECVPGKDLHACGKGAVACADCASAGETCQEQVCAPPACSPTTCKGCCVGDVCAVGTQDNACGVAGAACVDCSASKKKCGASGCF